MYGKEEIRMGLTGTVIGLTGTAIGTLLGHAIIFLRRKYREHIASRKTNRT